MTFGELLDVRSKKYLIIYLDILGYKDFIARHGEGELYASVEKMWITASSFFSASLKTKDGSALKFDIGIKMYSDNILIFTLLEDDELDSLRCTLSIALCAVVQFVGLEECNLLLRGAITHGECCIGNYIFGKPFLNAYHMESKSAEWSRILVSEETVNKYIPLAVQKQIIKEDSDGFFHRLFDTSHLVAF